jgi:hypothetical protein
MHDARSALKIGDLGASHPISSAKKENTTLKIIAGVLPTDQVPLSVVILGKTVAREDAVAEMPINDHGNTTVVVQG